MLIKKLKIFIFGHKGTRRDTKEREDGKIGKSMEKKG
jgi:hypothetical protein